MEVMKKKTSKDTRQRHRYRYVVHITEETQHSTTIESDRRLNWLQLEKVAQQRRIDGKLEFLGVTGVDMYCEAAYRDGVEMGTI
jgi:hypothetical protein